MAALMGAILRVELEEGARLAADFVDRVGLAEKRERGSIGAGGGLDDVGDEAFFFFLVEIAEVLAAEFHVLAQVVLAAVGDALELADSERKGVLDIGGGRRVESQLIGVVVAKAKRCRTGDPGRRTTGILPFASRRTTPWLPRGGRRTRSPFARIRASGR